MLTVGYNIGGGVAPVVYGVDTGTRGVGRIDGEVFLDENDNGRRDGNEKPLPGITVYLDRRFTAVTDVDGRYEFGPVTTGPHEIQVAVWDAPLPWGLDDESPRIVNVGVRDRARFDFALTKVGGR